MLKTAQNYQDYFQKSYYKYIHMKIFLTWNKIKNMIVKKGYIYSNVQLQLCVVIYLVYIIQSLPWPASDYFAPQTRPVTCIPLFPQNPNRDFLKKIC